MKPRPFVIAGEVFDSAETIAVRNPWDGELIARVCAAGPEDVSRALSAAQEAFARTRTVSPHERSRLLAAIAAGIARRAGVFADTIVAEAGKPLTLAKAEVERARATFEVAASAALEPRTQTVEMEATSAGAGHSGTVRRFPLGVILGITPFNFPLNLVAHKVAPCLATGNTMVLKPSPRTPLTALLLGEVLSECGAPPGQITFLPFDHKHAEGLLNDPRVKMLTFTGGSDTGWKLKAAAPKLKMTLELGGNAACVVESDSFWRKHTAKMVAGAFANAGQSCISVQRIFVHDSAYRDFLDDFLRLARETAVAGDPRDLRTMVGPMISQEALAQTVCRIREAESRGARLLTPLKVEGQVLHPVVLENVPRDAAICRGEAFAPVVVMDTYRDFDDALDAVNDSPFGLQAGVFTADPTKMRRAFEVLEVGAVLVNQAPAFRTENMPYGGVKDSGCGREGVRYAMQEMTEPRLLVVNEREG